MSFSQNSTDYFRATAHFGCVPLATNISSKYMHCKVSPGIIAPAVLQVSSSLSKKLYCDETSPMVTLGTGSYADFHLSEATFMHPAFWALPFFSSTTVGTRADWSYVVQWLMWQTGRGLTVYLPSSYRQYVRSSSSSAEIVNLLSQTDCRTAVDDCADRLLRKLLSLNLVSNQFVMVMTNWLRDLKKVGYVFPTVKRQQMEANCTISVMWSPVLASAAPTKRFTAVANVEHSAELWNRTCKETRHIKTGWTDFGVVVNLTHPWHQFHHLLFIITFNTAHYEVIPYLELLYRSLFPHIVYCGPTPLDTASFPALNGYRISFLTYTEWPVHRTPGSVSYQCAIQALRMNFPVDGYLFASDDLLLLPVPLSRLSKDRVWFVPTNKIRIGDLDTLRECHLGMCDFHPHWDWWATYKSATIEALGRMSESAQFSPLLYQCLAKLRQQNGVGRSQIRVNGAYSDIFYIPSGIAHDFADVAEVFAEFGVFLEIAVPTVLKCIEPVENFLPLPGKDIQVPHFAIFLVTDYKLNIFYVWFTGEHQLMLLMFALMRHVDMHAMGWRNVALTNHHTPNNCISGSGPNLFIVLSSGW